MSFVLTILGTSSGLPTTQRFSTAHALNVHERFFLIDCGEGTQIQLRRYKIRFQRINHIFISHLHGDHYFGIFGVLSSFNMLGRTADLHIYAHPDLQKKIEFVLFPEQLQYKIIYHSLNYEKSEMIYENKTMFVRSFPLKHRVPTCGFLFKEKKKEKKIRKEIIESLKLSIRDIVSIKAGNDFMGEDGKRIPNADLTFPEEKSLSYAYCSDTKYFEEILNEIGGVDVMYHESTFLHEHAALAHQTGHSTAREAGLLAQKAGAKQLVLGHFSARYSSEKLLENDARKEFENTLAANDGAVFDLEEMFKI